MIKRTIPIVAGILLSSVLSAQVDAGSDNFYETIQDLYENDRAVNLPDEEKNGKGKEIDRANRFWAPRLAPHGEVSMAAEAYVEYVNNFNAQSRSAGACGLEPATWQEEGPYDDAHYSGGGNGQINRITYDPQFNGTTNKTIYAGSFHGGLWRSTDDGENWSVLSTDHQLPQTSVSGIGIDFQNSNNIFISTGNGDHLNLDKLDPGFPSGRSTPILTSGIYRSMDYGVTWNAINTGFISHFTAGGTTTDLKVDPSDANTVYVASSEGLFRTTNGLAGSPSWSKITLPAGVDDFVSGLEIHPTTASTVYASSDEIVMSTNSGTSWTKLTGAGTTLDFSTLPGTFDVKRIKLAVTSAAVDDLYAIFIGDELANNQDVLYVYRYTGGTWTQLYYSHSSLPTLSSDHISTGWMGFAVSPIDADRIYLGSVKFRQFIYNGQWHSLHAGNPHDDIHEIVFEPTVPGKAYPDFMIAHHGGISQSYTHPHPNVPLGVKYLQGRSSGINTSMLWGLDVSKVDPSQMVISRQDNGTHERIGSSWSSLLAGGDGYGAMYADEGTPNEQRFILSSHFSAGDYNYSAPVDASHAANSATAVTRNYSSFVLQNGSWGVIGFKNKQHPTTGKTIFGFSELWSEIAPFGVHPRNYAKVQSDMYADPAFNWKGNRRITDFAIAKSNDNYAYIVTHGRDGVGRESDFLRTTTGLSNDQYIDTYAGAPTPPAPKFSMLNSGLPTVSYNGASYRPYITGVTVSTTNHLNVWISISGFFSGQKIYKSTDGGVTWANADPNGCLPNLPTNTLQYQDGTDDRIYLAMDDGIYVTDNSMGGNWKKFGDLPNVTVHQLIINECSNRIYAGTYGRGVWSTELLPRTQGYGELVFNNNTTISESRTVSGNIRVTAGNKLTVTATLYMAEGASIIVEPNAILEVDGGTLTNSCGSTWSGIQLIGNNSQNQLPLNHPTHQAKLELKNGALIEYAEEAIAVLETGVWNTFGGLVQAEDATIRNMRRAVSFMSYPHTNYSYFKRCTFENTADPIHSSTPLSMVTLWDNHGASFIGCTFIDNTGLNQYHHDIGNGIYSIDASYSVLADCDMATPMSPCPSQYVTRTSFTNFNQGIYATGSAGSSTIVVDETDFIDNAMGCRVEGFDNVRFTRNTTLTGNVWKGDYDAFFAHMYGFYASQSTGYEIEQNTFEGRKSPVYEVVGVRIVQSGKLANEVYNNTFKENEIGQVFDARNRNPSNSYEGLQFLCNTNPVSNQKDVEINERASGGSAAKKDGIRDYQGSNSPDLSAGNIFSTSTQAHIENNTLNTVYYFYQTTAEEPTVYTAALVVPKTVSTGNECTNRYWEPGGEGEGGEEGEGERSAAEDKAERVLASYQEQNKRYQELLATYNQRIDGGSTVELLKEIELSQPSNAGNLRNSLMNIAPYLSEQALWAVANSGALTDEFLLEVIMANPDASRNEGFLNLLEFEISNPLPKEMVEQIHQNWTTETSRTRLEYQLADLNAKLGRSSSQLVHHYSLNRTNYLSNVKGIYESQGGLGNQYQLVELAVESAGFEQAVKLLNQIAENSLLDEADLAEHKNLEQYVAWRTALAKSGTDYMNVDASKLQELREIAALRTGRSSRLAQNILCFGYGECRGEESPTTDAQHRTYQEAYNTNLSDALSSLEVELVPNPARDFVTVNVSNLAQGAPMQLTLETMQGQEVLRQIIQSTAQQVGIHDLSPGMYIYQVVRGDEVLSTGKLIVQ